MLRPTPSLLSIATLGFALAAVVSGCGDDGPSSPGPDPGPTVALDGTAALPAGWPGDLAALTVVDGAGASAVGAAGGFELPVARDDAQLAAVVGPDGDPLLLGWFGEERTRLDLRSTSEVLVWYGLGAWLLPPGGGAFVRGALADPATDLAALEAALGAHLAAHPDGFSGADPALQAALAAVVEGLRTPVATGLDGLTIDPTVQRSGIEVLNEGGINRITIKNSYRRRVAGFLWRDAWEDTLGAVHDFEGDGPFLELEIDPIAGFGGTFSTIIAALTDGQAYDPVRLEPIELPYHPGARRTFFHFNALGVGLLEPLDPDEYTTAERAAGEWMALKCLVVDYFLPMLVNAAGPLTGAGTFDDAFGGEGMAGQLNDYIAFVRTELPNFYTSATGGDWWGALLELWNAFLTNGTISEWTYGLVGDGLMALEFTGDETERIVDASQRFFACVGIADVVGGFSDSVIMGYHLGECRTAEHWELAVTAPVLHIEPRGARLNVFGTQLLTLVIDDDTGAAPDGSAYAYRWSGGGGHGTLVNPIDPGDTGNDFVTSSDFVQYVADVGVAGTDTVRCELMATLGGVQSRIGEAFAVMDVYRREVVLPDTIYACPDGSSRLDPRLEPPFDDGGVVHWHWTNLGAPGRLFHQNDETDWSSLDGTAFFEGLAGGTGLIRCIADVSYDGGATTSPVDTALVRVIVDDLAPFHGSTRTITTLDLANGSCGCEIYYAFAPIPGVSRYSVDGTGFDDPYFYGTEIHASVDLLHLPPRSVRTEDLVMISLSWAFGSCGPDDPPSHDELCGWLESRFAGAVWVITPDCDF